MNLHIKRSLLLRMLGIAPLRWILIRLLVGIERLESGVAFDPTARAFQRNPYPAYRALQTKDPVHRSRLIGGQVLTGYDDVMKALGDNRLGADRSELMEQLPANRRGPFFQFVDQSLLSLNPPDHTRLRGLVSKAFTPRAVASMQPRIEAITHELLDQVAANGEMDLIRDLAYPLPVIVIAEMLGVPAEHRDRFKAWSDDLGAGLDPFVSDEVLAKADAATLALREYFAVLFEERRKEPREDLLSALVLAEDEGESLNEEELYASVILLLGAGNETTTNLIGNGMQALLQHPDQLAMLRDDPALIDAAIEEMLRFDGPVQFTTRIAGEPMEFAGAQLERLEMVMLVLGAANRDPRYFPKPDEFNIVRPPGHTLAFGHGIHFCLGAPLARLEARVASPTLLQRMPHLQPVQPVSPYRETVVLRGLKRLPVTFSPDPVERSA